MVVADVILVTALIPEMDLVRLWTQVCQFREDCIGIALHWCRVFNVELTNSILFLLDFSQICFVFRFFGLI